MTRNEKLYHDALLKIASRDCAGFCGIIAQKALQSARDENAAEVIRRGEQVRQIWNDTFGRKRSGMD